MKRTFFLMFCLAGCLIAQAQHRTISTDKPYFYDEFKLGLVLFADGEAGSAKLNYNFVLQEMQFLDQENNDRILNLVRNPDIMHIVIGEDIFVPVGKQGYAFVIQEGPVTLLEKRNLVRDEKKINAYGVSAVTSSVDVATHLNVDGANNRVSNYIERQFNYLVLSDYWLMKNRKIYPATKKNYLKLYPEFKVQIEKYLLERKINFKNEAHLRDLSDYCNSLLMGR